MWDRTIDHHWQRHAVVCRVALQVIQSIFKHSENKMSGGQRKKEQKRNKRPCRQMSVQWRCPVIMVMSVYASLCVLYVRARGTVSYDMFWAAILAYFIREFLKPPCSGGRWRVHRCGTPMLRCIKPPCNACASKALAPGRPEFSASLSLSAAAAATTQQRQLEKKNLLCKAHWQSLQRTKKNV